MNETVEQRKLFGSTVTDWKTPLVPPSPTRYSESLQSSDEALVKAAREGDESAWSEIVHRYAALVYAIPARYGMDESTADDVFQDVFAALLHQLDAIRDVKSLPKWFITTTHRICWRMMRKSGRETTFGAVTLEQDAPPEEQAMQWERQHMVRLALDRLGGRCAELLTVLYRDDAALDYVRIARELDMPIGSIGPTRGRCLRKLLGILRDMDFPPD